jgi:hypothetical protein
VTRATTPGRVGLVLAQASLAHLAEPLADQLGLQVLASPELLVQEVVARLRD